MNKIRGVVVLCLITALICVKKFQHRHVVERIRPSSKISSRKLQLEPSSSLFNEFNLTDSPMLKPLRTPRPHFKLLMLPNITQGSPRCSKKQKIRWSMIVAIKSDYRRYTQRDVIRRTWGGIRLIGDVQMFVIYVVARPESQKEQSALKTESNKFGDLLQVEMNETYSGIGYKAMAAMHWVGEHFPDNWMYFSADDDIVPNLDDLLIKLESLFKKAKRTGSIERSLPIHCAFRYIRASLAKRSGKWLVTQSEYPLKRYPPSCMGAFYGMSVKLAKAIYNASRHYPYFRNDDIFLTAFMRLVVCEYSRDQFDFTSGKFCAISKIPSSNFNHIHVEPKTYVKLWSRKEKLLHLRGAKICKR